MLTFNIGGWELAGFAIQFLLPLLVGLVTKRVHPAILKTVLLAALTVVTTGATAALAAHNAGQAFDVGNAVLVALSGFTVALASHYGLWKPTGTSAALQDIGTKRLREVRPNVFEDDGDRDASKARDDTGETSEDVALSIE